MDVEYTVPVVLLLITSVVATLCVLIFLNSKFNHFTLRIIELGFFVIFSGALIPPIVSASNYLYESLAFIMCLLLVGSFLGLLKREEWVFDIISAFLFGLAVDLVINQQVPTEVVFEVLGLAIVAAGIARGAGLYAVDPADGD